MTRRRLWIAAQLAFVVALVVFLGYALRDAWADAARGCATPTSSTSRSRRCCSPSTTASSSSAGSGSCVRCRVRGLVLGRAPGRDGVDAREVRSRRDLDAAAARVVWLRKAGVDAATPLVVVSRSCSRPASRRLRRPRLRRRAADRRGRRRAARAARAVRRGRRRAAAPARLPLDRVRVFRPFGGIELPPLPYACSSGCSPTTRSPGSSAARRSCS